MSVKVLTEHPYVFRSLKGGCIGSSESTLVKIPHCCKSHVAAHLLFSLFFSNQIACLKAKCFKRFEFYTYA